MLLPTMTNAEIHAEVMRDYKQLQEVTFPRLHLEYCKERHKLKIDKTKLYPKTYKIKTGSKNNWIFNITRSLNQPKHRTAMDQHGRGMVHYFGKEGSRFLRPHPQHTSIELYYGHFFTRYNQRMGLNLLNNLDAAAHFLAHSSATLPVPYQKDGKDCLACLCKSGIALGVTIKEPAWRVYKTFISHDLKRQDQKLDEQKLQEQVRREIFWYVQQFAHANDRQYQILKSGYEQIFGSDHVIVQTFKLLDVPQTRVNPVLPPSFKTDWSFELPDFRI